MENAFIHIGTPKTGTSIIQSHLAQNRELLRDRGFLYPITISSNPKLYRTFESNHLLFYSLAGWDPFSQFSPDAFFDRARTTAEENDLHTMILSAENSYWLPRQLVANEKPDPEEYWQGKDEFVGKVAAAMSGFNTRIVVYLRRQDRWIESWYNQQVKNGVRLTPDFMDFVENNDYLLDYDRVLGVWADHFGAENLIVRSYEKEQLKDGLFADFAESVGIGDAGDFPLKEAARYNAQLDRDALEFLNICNQIDMEPEERYWLRIKIRKITKQFESQKIFAQQGFLSPPNRLEVLNRYEEVNRRVSDRYRDGVALFQEAKPDPDGEWLDYPGLPTEVAAKLMMEILLEMRRELVLEAKKEEKKEQGEEIDAAELAKGDLAFWKDNCWGYKAL